MLVATGGFGILAALWMPTHVWVNGLGEVVNRGLQQQQLVGLIAAGVLAIVGSIGLLRK